MSVTSSFSQKKNVSQAKNKALMENPDFAAARQLITPALQDPTTKDLASTWYTAGLIGYQENDAELKKQMLGQKFDADVKGKAIMESYGYFLKAYELDGLPDAKGKVKPKFQKDIKSKIKEYYTTQANLVAYGASLFERKKYDETIKVFETYLGIPALPMMNNEIKLDSTYYMIKYFTGIAAINGGMHDKAITYLEDLKDDGYEELVVHQLLYDEYLKRKDTVNFVRVLKEGYKKFPKEAYFLENLINYYIYTNQSKEAIVYLNNAIEREPNRAEYQYIKGNLDESLGNIDAAMASFEKAIEIDPKLADAWAGKGRLIYNKAVQMSDAANEIKDNKKYNAAKKEADAVFEQSVPFFKKAAELKPDVREYKQTLKTLYYRLKKDKEFEAIEKELNAM
jgi:tetratricopeptide (TPR) repeat protein